jgi:hypothetical protein
MRGSKLKDIEEGLWTVGCRATSREFEEPCKCLRMRLKESGTLKIDYIVVYKLMLCEHPVPLAELRPLTCVSVRWCACISSERTRVTCCTPLWCSRELAAQYRLSEKTITTCSTMTIVSGADLIHGFHCLCRIRWDWDRICAQQRAWRTLRRILFE